MSEEEKSQQDEPRPHVDEDWKQSVQNEKERMRAEEEGESAASDAAETPQPAESEPPREEVRRERPRATLPKPTLELFLSGFYSQALVALGAMENPMTGKKERHPDEASYIIDTLALLRDKMQGNLSPQEDSYLGNMLTDLRMRYVTAPNADS